MRFKDQSWVDSALRHGKRCKEAQALKQQILMIKNKGKSLETCKSPPSHKSNIPNNTDMNGTSNSEHTKQNLSTDSNSNSTSISIQPSQPDSELWENWQEWDFITIHTGMNEKLKNTLIQFQKQNPFQWKLSSHSSGISGSLVNTVGQIFRCIHQLPLFKSMHYFFCWN